MVFAYPQWANVGTESARQQHCQFFKRICYLIILLQRPVGEAGCLQFVEETKDIIPESIHIVKNNLLAGDSRW